jgi:hypothetical protein
MSFMVLLRGGAGRSDFGAQRSLSSEATLPRLVGGEEPDP